MDKSSLAHLKTIEQRLLWLACWTVHHANHLRDPDEVKVGGHQASSASMVSIMTALYFHVLRPEDRVAVKPHASPVFHAAHYLMGQQTREKLEQFRGFGGAQSYPSRTKDGDDVDFSTGSVGLGVAVTAFASIIQDYLAARSWLRDRPLGRMVAWWVMPNWMKAISTSACRKHGSMACEIAGGLSTTTGKAWMVWSERDCGSVSNKYLRHLAGMSSGSNMAHCNKKLLLSLEVIVSGLDR